MRDYITLGPTPAGESCAQVGDPNYNQKSKQECRRYIHLLIDKFGNPPLGVNLKTKAFHHDFGTYHEVICEYEDNDDITAEYCYYLEANIPEYWEDD